MHRITLVAILMVVAVFALAACGGDDPTPTPLPPTATPEPAAPPAPPEPTPTLRPGQTPVPPTPTPPDPTATPIPAWQLEMEAALAAAKEEGEVHVWVGGGGNAARNFLELEFEKAYPDIDVILLQGARSSEVQSRYLTEWEAGVASVDLFNGGISGGNGRLKPAGALQPIKPFLVTPEVTDPDNWLGGDMWVDEEEEFIWIGDGSTNAALAIADSVDAASITSWRSLLEPRFKGKIIMTDPRGSGGGGGMTAFWMWAPAYGDPNPVLGPDFISRLFSTQEVVFSSDRGYSLDQINSGKMLLHVAPDSRTYQQLQEIGAAPELIPTLPVYDGGPTLARMGGSPGILFVPNIDLPHPNAAKVYINWFYSKAGGQALADIRGAPSRRADVDNSKVLSFTVPDLTGPIMNLMPTTCCVNEYRDLVSAAVGE